MRANVEREGGDWWSFFDEKFTGYIKSRSYAEKLMRWAKSDDPEGALNAERERKRDVARVARDREAKDSALRSADEQSQSLSERTEYDIVEHTLRLVERMSTDERVTLRALANAERSKKSRAPR